MTAPWSCAPGPAPCMRTGSARPTPRRAGTRYRKQGTYTVRAESQWSVAWSGMGLSGTIPVTLTDSATITIGELQVLTTG